VDIRPSAGGATLVRLGGRLPIGWAGHLTRGLSRAGISVLRGSAHWTKAGQWTAQLHVVPAAPGVDPLTVDYLRLAMDPGPWEEPAAIELVSFRVEQPAPRGELRVNLRGRDRVGFLGSLLYRLAGLSLFPEELRVETEGEWAVDALALRATGGLAPSPAAHRALVALLTQLAGKAAAAGSADDRALPVGDPPQ
jgi:hypothetical protein